MNDAFFYPLAAIIVIALITCFLRAIPFMIFGKRPLPKVMQYLGKVLPPAIMTILVFYCLKDINFHEFPFGAAEIISCALVAFLHIFKKNMYLSIVAGTLCYMILIRVL